MTASGDTVPAEAPPTTGRLLLVALAAYAAAGLVAGVVWRQWSGTEQYDVKRSVGYPVGVGTSPELGNDLRFALLGLVLGALATAVVARRGRRYGPWLVAIALPGSLGGGLLAWAVGAAGQPGPVPEQLVTAGDGSVLTAPLELLAPVLLVAWPVAAAVVVLVVTWATDRPGPGRRWADGPPEAVRPPPAPGADGPGGSPAEPASGGPAAG